MVKLEISGEDATQFSRNLAGVFNVAFSRLQEAVRELTEANAEPATDTPAGETPKRGRGRPRKDASVATPSEPATVEATPPAADAEKPAETPSEPETVREETPTVGNADVKAALIALMEKKGEDAPPAVLCKFGVKKISELKAEQYAAVVATANEAAAG